MTEIVKKYQPRPEHFEAAHFDIRPEQTQFEQYLVAKEIADWCGGEVILEHGSPNMFISIVHPHRQWLAVPGDFIVKTPDGDISLYPEDIFQGKFVTAMDILKVYMV